jgi:hypothetical protein
MQYSLSEYASQWAHVVGFFGICIILVLVLFANVAWADYKPMYRYRVDTRMKRNKNRCVSIRFANTQAKQPTHEIEQTYLM